ncbi:MAG: pilus assembly protein [Betaproteobacteria bacterium]|nr:pilus assembly protein [Betaproteobacteria bacterium]
MTTTFSPFKRRHRARGFALIASLLIMVVMTIIVVTMFRSFGLQERIAGNVREKQKAFQAAQTAVAYAEWWLTQGSNASNITACTGLLSANSGQAVVCNAPLVDYTAVPWKVGASDVGVTYTPPNMNVASSGADSYASAPRFYIVSLGLSPDGQSQLYRISAMAYGGNTNAVAVLQSTYAISTGVRNLGGL